MLDCKIDRLLRFAGVDIYNKYLETIIGRVPELEEPEFGSLYNLTFFLEKDGYLEINKKDINLLDGEIEWERQEGDKIKPPVSIADTVAWFLTNGKDPTELERKIEQNSVQKVFSVS